MSDADGTHVLIFESSQLEGSYVGDLLYRQRWSLLTLPISEHSLPSSSFWSLSAVSHTRALGCRCFQVRVRTPCVICCFSPFTHKKHFAEASGKKLSSEYMQKCHSSKMDVRVSSSVSSVAQSCLTLCDPMDCSMPGLPVYCQFLEFTQTLIH